MHCKICLKKSQYFSSCLHPYCEKCFAKQNYCTQCKSGTGTEESSFYNMFSCFNLNKILNFKQLIKE